MSDPLFDTFLVVDWSARATPSPAAPSKDAIWYAVVRDGEEQPPVYVRTRAEARSQIADILQTEVQQGRRVLAGFDFPFGYPAGVAERLTGEASAMALWEWLEQRIEDHADNRSNRFDIAELINAAYDGQGPFWGRPETAEHPGIPTRAKERHGSDHPPERRLIEDRVAGAKTVWQLAYAGAVGSQVLVGLPALQALLRQPGLRERTKVWPLETGLQIPDAQIVLAEVYPSLLATKIREEREDGDVLDAVQVSVTARHLAALDAKGQLGSMFKGPSDLDAEARERICREEGWILGVADRRPADRHKPTLRRMSYERAPSEIYAKSFAIVRDEARLDRFDPGMQILATRLIHSCGMVEVADRLAFSKNAFDAGRAALERGAPILCDCEMVGAGIIRRYLPRDNEVIVTLNAREVPERACAIGNTRSAAAVELWADHLGGAVVAIGNAPTALFHLLELLDQGLPQPAVILGFPVGFVGAAESKAELAARPRGCEFVALRGRRGGSAMASAAVNALAAGLPEETR